MNFLMPCIQREHQTPCRNGKCTHTYTTAMTSCKCSQHLGPVYPGGHTGRDRQTGNTCLRAPDNVAVRACEMTNAPSHGQCIFRVLRFACVMQAEVCVRACACWRGKCRPLCPAGRAQNCDRMMAPHHLCLSTHCPTPTPHNMPHLVLQHFPGHMHALVSMHRRTCMGTNAASGVVCFASASKQARVHSSGSGLHAHLCSTRGVRWRQLPAEGRPP
jgi:hypothetical protein